MERVEYEVTCPSYSESVIVSGTSFTSVLRRNPTVLYTDRGWSVVGDGLLSDPRTYTIIRKLKVHT